MSFQEEWSQSLRAPGRAPPSGLSIWNGSNPAQRFNVYRNNVFVSLVEVLGGVYPVVKELVGEEFFRAAAREFITGHFPTSPVMSRYGAQFGDWLDVFPPVQQLPYLGDVARLEWARLSSYDSRDERPATADELGKHLSELHGQLEVDIQLHPSAFLLCFATPAISLWAAHQDEAHETLSHIDLGAPEFGLVVRRSDEVVVIRTTKTIFQAMQAIAAARTLCGLRAACVLDRFSPALAMLLENEALVLGSKE